MSLSFIFISLHFLSYFVFIKTYFPSLYLFIILYFPSRFSLSFIYKAFLMSILFFNSATCTFGVAKVHWWQFPLFSGWVCGCAKHTWTVKIRKEKSNWTNTVVLKLNIVEMLNNYLCRFNCSVIFNYVYVIVHYVTELKHYDNIWDGMFIFRIYILCNFILFPSGHFLTHRELC